LLLHAGASLKFVDIQRGGLTILHWLARYADRDTWALFHKANLTGLDTEQEAENGDTALQMLVREHPNAEEGLLKAFKSLLDQVRQVNISIDNLEYLDNGFKAGRGNMPGTWVDEN
jgi:hypothetical protein